MNHLCEEKLRFSTTEKIVAAVPFNASILIGAYGLYLTSWVLTAVYLTFTYVGFVLMMRYTLCPRCPHLLKGNDCLNMPVSIVKKLIAKDRTGHLNIYEKAGVKIMKYGMLVVPLYWLTPHVYLLIAFIVFYLLGQATFYLHFCKHCSNEVCMQHPGKRCVSRKASAPESTQLV